MMKDGINRTGTVLTRDQLTDVVQAIMESSRADILRIQIQHTAKSVTRVANNRVMSSNNGSELLADIDMSFGGKMSVTLNTNRLDKDSIRALVPRLDALARVQTGSVIDYLNMPDGAHNYMPVSLWYDTTAQAMKTVGETVSPNLIAKLSGSGLLGSCFLGLMARSTLVVQRDGLSAFNEETDTECVVSAMSRAGKSSGWYGQANRDWSAVRPENVADRAIELAKRGENPLAFEPGRRTAILSPFAVAQLLRHVSSQFDAYATNVIGATAFSSQGNPEKRNKIGMRVLDSKLRISSDPSDPEGGYIPFSNLVADGGVLPLRKQVWIEQGILKDLAYPIYYGLYEGKEFNQNPWSMRVEAEPGSRISTIDEMISNCQSGIYVNRFSDVTPLDGRTCMLTGVTRDGCFLIQDGKISKPIKNLRFLDSPLFALNQIEAIGKPERVAFGYTPGYYEIGYAGDWPRRPMIVPPIMVRSFNFNALSDAV